MPPRSITEKRPCGEGELRCTRCDQCWPAEAGFYKIPDARYTAGFYYLQPCKQCRDSASTQRLTALVKSDPDALERKRKASREWAARKRAAEKQRKAKRRGPIAELTLREAGQIIGVTYEQVRIWMTDDYEGPYKLPRPLTREAVDRVAELRKQEREE